MAQIKDETKQGTNWGMIVKVTFGFAAALIGINIIAMTAVGAYVVANEEVRDFAIDYAQGQHPND